MGTNSQMNVGYTRRGFLRCGTRLTTAASLAPGLLVSHALRVQAAVEAADSVGNAPQKPLPGLKLGILLGTFSGPTLEKRLDAAKACGLDCVQLSMDCAGLSEMPDQIPAELAARIKRAASERDIAIASVQGTFNMSHPDPEERKKGLRRLAVLARACPELGTTRIHLCTGTRDRQSMWRRHPENDSPETWRDMAACVRAAAVMAQETGVVLAFEPEVNNVVDSAQKARRLLDEIGSPQLKVTIDPANIFHTGELPRMKEILDEAFSLLGKDIVLAHAKDLDHDGDAGHKAAGEGKLDYPRYLCLLRKYGFSGPVLLHGLSEKQVPGSVAFLRRAEKDAARLL